MNFENKVKQALQERSKKVTPPVELKERVLHHINPISNGNRLKRRIIAGVIAACFIIPTGAMAYQAYLVDELYGSFDNVKKHISTATMENYMLLNARLSQVRGELGQEEYNTFKEHLKVLSTAKLEYGDSYGNIDYDLVPEVNLLQIKQALFEIQPYFDRLNNDLSSKEVLNPEEYELYIEALMTYEKIVVQSGINPSEGVNMEDIRPDLQETFASVQNTLQEVNRKVSTESIDVFFPIPTFTINQEQIYPEYGLPTFLSEAENASSVDILPAFVETLTSSTVAANSMLKINFDTPPHEKEIHIYTNEGELLTSSTSETIQLPGESGQYIVLISGQWANEKLPFVFPVVVK